MIDVYWRDRRIGSYWPIRQHSMSAWPFEIKTLKIPDSVKVVDLEIFPVRFNKEWANLYGITNVEFEME